MIFRNFIFPWYNCRLKTLSGLESLSNISGSLLIYFNDSLLRTNLPGSIDSINNLSILGNNGLENLSGLEKITSLGVLNVHENSRLKTLAGLDSLVSVQQVSIEDNASLIDLSGLGKLNDIEILYVDGNSRLKSLSGLENLTTCDWVSVTENDSLLSLKGIDNINPASIGSIQIAKNNLLEECSVKSICDYLAKPNAHVNIFQNAKGCNSRAEVDTACRHLSVENITIDKIWALYPNPASTNIRIETPDNGTLYIYSIGCQQLFQQKITEPNTTIDVSGLRSGVYFVKVVGEEGVKFGKFLKQ